MPEDKKPSSLPDIPIDSYRPTGQLPPEEVEKGSRYRPLLIGLAVILCVTIVLVFFQPLSLKEIGSNLRHLPTKITALFSSKDQTPLSPSTQPQVEVSELEETESAGELTEETPLSPQEMEAERYRLQIEELQEELVGLRSENEKLQEDIKRRGSELDRLNKELKGEQKRGEEAEKKVAQAEEELQSATTSYEAEIKSLKERTQKDREAYEGKIRELQNRLTAAQEGLDAKLRLYDSRSQKEAEAVADILRQAQENRQKREEAETALSAAQSEIARLKEQLAQAEERAERVHEGDLVPLDEDVIKPEIIKSPLPRYPLQARRRGIEGVVIINVLISETGDVLRAKVVNPSPEKKVLEEAALEAVKKWKFSSAMKDGQRVRVWMIVPVKFKS